MFGIQRWDYLNLAHGSVLLPWRARGAERFFRFFQSQEENEIESLESSKSQISLNCDLGGESAIASRFFAIPAIALTEKASFGHFARNKKVEQRRVPSLAKENTRVPDIGEHIRKQVCPSVLPVAPQSDLAVWPQRSSWNLSSSSSTNQNVCC